jgi:FtsP/CotA-like multicopper oxidase with cupredoxin domain
MMSLGVSREFTRRSLLVGGTGLMATAALRSASAATALPANEFKLIPAKGRVSLVGKRHPDTEVWCYNGRVPGPEIRVRQGEPVRIVVENKLTEGTTVHWHGIRLPIAMDGVPGISQPSIQPQGSFSYEFTPPDAGTFWYHPHADTLQQLGRGMAGALIIEEPLSVLVDRDVLWLITDWRLSADAQIAPGFGNGMEAAMSGRVGNTVTINGAVSDEVPVRAGERIRLRLVNGSLARIMALRFQGHRPAIIAIDGQSCDPHEPDGGRILLGPAMRVDLAIDMRGEPGRRYRVVDDFYDGLSYWLTQFVYENKPPLRAHSHDAPLALPHNSVPEPDLAAAERHELRLQGGMMGGRAMAGMGGMGMGGMGMDHDASWAINGMSMTGDGQAGMPPLLTLQLGHSYVLTLRNDTAWWHPMHLHGHSFRVLRRSGADVQHRQWADTVLIPPKEAVDIAFVADNPGDWMLHCHVADHQVSGMMTILRIA